jgi:signal transduction histidine kinase
LAGGASNVLGVSPRLRVEERAVGKLVGALLDDLERIAKLSMAGIHELLPSYAKVPAEARLATISTNMREILEAIRDPDADPSRAEDHCRVTAEPLELDLRIRTGITADEMLLAWWIAQKTLREEAYLIADQLGIADEALLEFEQAGLQWGDVALRKAASAYRESETRQLKRIAAEQAALRRVATLVAQGVASNELFGAVALEVGRLFGADYTGIYEPEPTFVRTIATWAAVGVHPPVPNRWRTVPGDPTTMVANARKPARVDDWTNVPGPIAEFVRGDLEVKSSVGCPIVVDGSLWGVLTVHSKRGPLPPDTESRLLSFTKLIATAIANTSTRAEVARLAEEQAALRRVATRVAEGDSPSTVLDAVAAETERALGADGAMLLRYEPDEQVTVVARHFPSATTLPVGTRISHKGHNVSAMVRRSARPARIEDYGQARGPLADALRSAEWKAIVGAPITVDGRLWGVTIAIWRNDVSPPAETEERMAQFAELIETAIANADSRDQLEASRDELRVLAEQQAALRRVATLVARGVPPEEVFAAVAEEVGQVLPIEYQHLGRFGPDGTVNYVAARGPVEGLWPAGTRLPLGGDNVTTRVFETGRAARTYYSNPAGAIGGRVTAGGIRWSVGAPIVVEGREWGVMVVSSSVEHPPPPDTEQRLTQFMELLGTAIANADSRDQLTASRARLVTEADEARRRVVRDLHDGAQQRLLQTIVTLKLAQRELDPSNAKAEAFIAEALAHAQQGNTELRELAHGILPAVLAQGGLRSGVRSIVSRLDLPVEIDVPSQRFPAKVEASAYFVVAEALTNVVKHAHAERAEVRACVEDGMLRVEVRDDGVGGVDPSGHGLVGLSDRVNAIGGQLGVESPESGGTFLAAKLPVSAS